MLTFWLWTLSMCNAVALLGGLIVVWIFGWRAVWRRSLYTMRGRKRSRDAILLLRYSMLRQYNAARDLKATNQKEVGNKVPTSKDRQGAEKDTTDEHSLSTPHPDALLRSLFGSEAILEVQKMSLELEKAAVKYLLAKTQKGSAGADSPDAIADLVLRKEGRSVPEERTALQRAVMNRAVRKQSKLIIAAEAQGPLAGLSSLSAMSVGELAETLLRSIQFAHIPIGLRVWDEAKSYDDPYLLFTLALPHPLIKLLLALGQGLEARLKVVGRLGAAYHNICARRHGFNAQCLGWRQHGPEGKSCVHVSEQCTSPSSSQTDCIHQRGKEGVTARQEGVANEYMYKIASDKRVDRTANKDQLSLSKSELMPLLENNFGSSLRSLWDVAQCPPLPLDNKKGGLRYGPHWRLLGFESCDPIADMLRWLSLDSTASQKHVSEDGKSVCLPFSSQLVDALITQSLLDMQWFASHFPECHRLMISDTEKEEGPSAPLIPRFSEAYASCLISLLLTSIPQRWRGEELTIVRGRGVLLQQQPLSSGSDTGDDPSIPQKSEDDRSATKHAGLFDPIGDFLVCDEHSVQCVGGQGQFMFSPSIVRFLYGGPAAVGESMASLATLVSPSKDFFDEMPKRLVASLPTGDDELLIQHRMRQIHSCYLRAYFDLWREERPPSLRSFLMNSFGARLSRRADAHLRSILF